MAISPALARLLADRRTSFNGRVAGARARNPAFDTAALSAFLAETLDPLLGHVLKARPDGGTAFIDVAFDMAVALVDHGWVGDQPRAQVIRKLWQEVAPALAPAIAANARETLGALTNAAIKLSQDRQVRLKDWMAALRSLAGRAAAPAELRALAILTAWRAGAAHLRPAALAVRLDPVLACAAVGAGREQDWIRLTARFTAHRWWTPDGSAPPAGHLLGGFTGFGGRFAEPPKLGLLGDAFAVSSVGEHFLLEADAYGATLRPISREDGEAATAARPVRLMQGGLLRLDDRAVPSDWPEDGLMLAETADSVAIVSPLSHAVRVLPKAMP